MADETGKAEDLLIVTASKHNYDCHALATVL